IDKLRQEKLKLKEDFKKKFCLLRFLEFKNYKREKDYLDKAIKQVENVEEQSQNNLEKLNSDIEILLEIQEDLSLIYSKLKKGIVSFCEIQDDFVEDFEKNPLNNYLFVNHVIDK